MLAVVGPVGSGKVCVQGMIIRAYHRFLLEFKLDLSKFPSIQFMVKYFGLTKIP